MSNENLFKGPQVLGSVNAGAQEMKTNQFIPDGGQVKGDSKNLGSLRGDTTFTIRLNSSNQWLKLNDSYFRMRLKLQRGDETPLQRSDGVGYARDWCNLAFQSVRVKLNGQVLEEVNFNGLTDVMTMVAGSTKAWLDGAPGEVSGWKKHLADPNVGDETRQVSDGSITYTAATGAVVGVGTNFTADMVGGKLYFLGRVATVLTHTDALNITVDINAGANAGPGVPYYLEYVVGGPESQQYDRIHDMLNNNAVNFTFKPPIGLLESANSLRGGQLQFVFTWSNNLFKQIVETQDNRNPGNGAGDYYGEIQAFDYWGTMISPDPDVSTDSRRQRFDLVSSRMQQGTITTTGQSQLSFQIPPSTYKIYVAFRNNTRDIANNDGGFPQFDDGGATSFYLSLPEISLTMPQPTYDMNYAIREVDRAYQDWVKASCGCDQTYEAGLNFEEWLSQYPIYGFRVVKNVDTMLSKLDVVANLSSAAPGTPYSCYVLCLYTYGAEVEYNEQGDAISTIIDHSI